MNALKETLEKQLGAVKEQLKNIYLPYETALILSGKRAAFEIALELIETLRAEIERIRSEAVMASFGNDSDWLRSRVATCVDILAFLDTLPEQGQEPEYYQHFDPDC